jgi:hypothetical protein
VNGLAAACENNFAEYCRISTNDMSREIKDEAKSLFFPRKLSKRTRPGVVERELATLAGQSTPVLLRRLSEKDKSRQLCYESMVSVLRHFVIAGDVDSSQEAFMAIAGRLSGAIANKLRMWTSIPERQMEDVRQTLLIGLYEFMFSLDTGEELWECNFKTSFDFRVWNILGKITRGSHPTLALNLIDDEEEQHNEPVDPDSERKFQSVEAEEALTHLDSIDSRLGRSFYLKYFVELSENEIAGLMEVSERTVRNWIGISKTELRQFFAG